MIWDIVAMLYVQREREHCTPEIVALFLMNSTSLRVGIITKSGPIIGANDRVKILSVDKENKKRTFNNSLIQWFRKKYEKEITLMDIIAL